MAEKTISILPIGGVGNITKNMYVYEYDNQRLIVDCGIGFPDDNMSGIDLIVPDVNYLKDLKDTIVGMVLTHAHDDHIGGLPYILPQIGNHFPIFGSKLTLGFAQDRISEFAVEANFQRLPDKPIELGPFRVDNVVMTHSVPDSRHLAITTPAGTIYHGSDYKFDLNPVDGVIPDFQKIARVSRGGVLALLSDCLNAEVPTFSLSESTLTQTFEGEMRGVAGKVVITVMSSNLHRIQQAVNVARGYGRKVAFIGRSIERNVQTALEMGFIKLPKNSTVNKYSLSKLSDKKLCLIVAGSQGQEGSSMVRVAEGVHKLAKINPEDRIIFASDAIPGNEASVYSTIDTLFKTGADVTYPDVDTSVHVSGHSSAVEQQLLIGMTKPTHLIPIGGAYHHMIQYRQLARGMGYKDDKIHLLENGQKLALKEGKSWIPETVTLNTMALTGDVISELDNDALEARSSMAEQGLITIGVPLNTNSGKLRGKIIIEPQGVPSFTSAHPLVSDILVELRQMLNRVKPPVRQIDHLSNRMTKQAAKLIKQELNLKPVITTLIIPID